MSDKFFVDYRWPSLWSGGMTTSGKTVAQFKAALADNAREEYLQKKTRRP